MEQKPQVVFVLGGPGAGKGTICSLLSKNQGYVHLSAGDLLREEKNSGSDLAQMILNYINEGQIVPSEVTVGLLQKAMKKNGWEKSKFLVDGFPRNKENVEGWDKVIGDSANVICCMYFDCSFATMEQRIMKRAVDSGRTDDNVEALKKRFVTYTTETKPIIDYFDSINKLVKIDVERAVEEVYQSTLDGLAKLVS